MHGFPCHRGVKRVEYAVPGARHRYSVMVRKVSSDVEQESSLTTEGIAGEILTGLSGKV
jgi:hypothetical protein